MALARNITFDHTTTRESSTVDVHRELGEYEKLSAAIAYVVIAALGISGNSLVIIAVALSRKLQTITNIFVVALAIADLLTAILQIVQAIVLLSTSTSRLLQDVCRVTAAVNFTLLGCSVITLALIAIYRMQVVTKKPASHFKPTRKKAVASIVILFSLTFLGCLSTIFIDNITFGIVRAYGTCYYEGGKYTDISMGVYLFFILCLIIVCYAKTYHHVRQHFRQVTHVHGGRPLRTIHKEQAGRPSLVGLQVTHVDSSNIHGSSGHSDSLDIVISSSNDAQTISKATTNSALNQTECNSRGVEVCSTDMGTRRAACNPISEIRRVESKQAQRTKQQEILPTIIGRLSDVPLAKRSTTSSSDEASSPSITDRNTPTKQTAQASLDISISRSALTPNIPLVPTTFYLDESEQSGMIMDNDRVSGSGLSSTTVAPSTRPHNQHIFLKRPNRSKIERKVHQENPMNAESRITLNMLLLVVTFFACITPSIILLFVPGDQAHSWISFLILFSNCCWNPMIYAWKHPDFKHTFGCIIRGKFSRIRDPVPWLRRRIVF